MKGKLFFLLIIAVIVTISFYIINYYKISTRNTIELLSEKKQMINILIVADNNFSGNKHTFYSILSINPENHKIGITFLPPELEIDLEGEGDVIPLGQVNIQDFKKLSNFINKTLNIKIPFYLTLYAPDVVRIVDLIEGIDLYVLDQIEGTSFKRGINYFSGEKIIKYINNVEDNSIFQKYDRIQDLLLTLYYNKNNYKKYKNIDFIIEATKTIRKNTNILPQELLSLFDLIMKDGDLLCTVLPGQYTNDGNYYIDEVSNKIYENKFLRKLIIMSDDENNIKVKIMNSTEIPGLAKKIRNMLNREGISVVEFGNYPGGIIEKTVIINQEGNCYSAKKTSELINVNKIYHKVDNSLLHNVLIIVGKDMAK